MRCIYIYICARVCMCVCVCVYTHTRASQLVLEVNNMTANAGDIRDMGLILGLKIPWRRAWQPTSGILVQRITWTEETGRLPSMGSQRVRYDQSDLAHMHAYTHNGTLLSLKNEILSLPEMWIHLQNIMLSEISQSNTVYHLSVKSKK